MILSREKVIERLRRGEVIHWTGGIEPHAWMDKDTVRWDTLCKLEKEGIVTNFGSPNLHGTVRLKAGV